MYVQSGNVPRNCVCPEINTLIGYAFCPLYSSVVPPRCAVSRDSPISACLTHVGNSWWRPDDIHQHLAADPYHAGLSGDAY